MADVTTFRGGGTPSKKNKSFWGGNIPWVSPKDMKSDLIDDSIDHVTPKAVSGSTTNLIAAGSVLVVVRSGILGRTIPIGLTTAEVTINQDIKAIVPNADLDSRYLFHFMRSCEPLILSKVTRSATVHRILTDILKDLSLPLPPLEEQKRIAAVLDEAFAAIDAAAAHTESNLASASELFDSALDRTFAQLDASHTLPLQEVCDSERIVTYGVVKTGTHNAEGVPCLRTSNVRRLRIDTDGMKRIDRSISDQYRRTILKGGEVLVAVRGTLGGVAVVPERMKGWNITREVAVVPLDTTKANAAFVAYCISASSSEEWLTGVKKGAAYVGINIEDLRTLPIKMPSLTVQREIVAAIAKVEKIHAAIVTRMDRKLAALAELRRSLLHRAFTGQLTSAGDDTP